MERRKKTNPIVLNNGCTDRCCLIVEGLLNDCFHSTNQAVYFQNMNMRNENINMNMIYEYEYESGIRIIIIISAQQNNKAIHAQPKKKKSSIAIRVAKPT